MGSYENVAMIVRQHGFKKSSEQHRKQCGRAIETLTERTLDGDRQYRNTLCLNDRIAQGMNVGVLLFISKIQTVSMRKKSGDGACNVSVIKLTGYVFI